MRWVISNWRLKLLALALTLGLLGAVAFSENPVTAVGVPATVDYDNRANNVVVVNPVLATTINLFGPASIINPLRNPSVSPSIHVRVDLRSVSEKDFGKQITFTATPKTIPSGATWTGDPVLVTVGVDQQKTKPLDIEVRTPKIAAGYKRIDADAGGKPLTYAFCGNQQQPCQVSVTAPASILDKLRAYVQVGEVTGTEDIPNQPVLFEEDGRPIDLAKASLLPQPGVDPPNVFVHVSAQQTQVSRQVALNVNVTGQPACGYAITGISFTPSAFVTIAGAADKIASVDSITLPNGIDVSGATSNVRSQQNVPSDNFTPSPTSVTVTVSIQKKADCTAPTPSPSPSKSP